MKRWQDFLDSLSTTGGGILITAMFVIVFLAVIVHVLHKQETGEIVTILTGAFGGAMSALWVALKSNSSKQQMVDRATPDAPTEPKP